MDPKKTTQIPMNPKFACCGVQAERACNGRSFPSVTHFRRANQALRATLARSSARTVKLSNGTQSSLS